MRTNPVFIATGFAATLFASTALADGVTLRALMEDVPETKIIESL